ncbi:DNA-processing protein DprA [Massilia endophytica]|uniref:DNA-processing protein DprA n=1 Tax=Massilia endophytica TaxID=2899220 RepID=UPI001E555101|nr:DNA-processing protein DprA [Massilia endophytica]UGQ47043.1 DNA-processing protein DprA [Massilia endophytica]
MQATDSPQHASQDAEELAAWLRFSSSPGVSRRTAVALVRRFGSPRAVQQALAEHQAVEDNAGLPPLTHEQARGLCAEPGNELRALAARTVEWAAKPGNTLLTFNDPAYPALLRQTDDPPLLLHIKGDAQLLAARGIAIVGARNASLQGKLNAEHFAQSLSDFGLTVFSGLARGIDAAAHRGALRGRASTVAVMATGIDRIYPAAHRELAHQLAEQGCIVSEFALGTPPCAWQFPVRNRIISGLARGVLVVEAAAASGSLITARSAAAQNREVFAIPGSIHATLSKGCHQLLREGAALVETVDDVLHGLGIKDRPRETMLTEELERKAHVLLDVLSYDAHTADALATHLQLDAAATQASLLALELAGLVERLPGGAFRRLKR